MPYAGDHSRTTTPHSASPASAVGFDRDTAWSAILALRDRHRAATAGPANVVGLHSAPHDLDPDVAEMFELYLPLCAAAGPAPIVIGHLGQSLDGRIATAAGNSRFVNGAANFLHLHRLRALADAVLVGAGTVNHDDPQLTVRLCPGPTPLRVVIDTNRTLDKSYRLFNDGAAPALVVCARDRLNGGAASIGGAEIVGVERAGDWLDARALLALLASRGVRSLLVEGGGVTVSRFLAAGALTRLQLTIAPVIIGSGRMGIALPTIDRMEQAMRPAMRRFVMGDDVLFECVFDRA